MTVRVAPFGSWKSPITSDLIAAGSVGLYDLTLTDDALYWVETRPNESGRNVIVEHTKSRTTTDVTPAPFSARTRVHEYGGGAFAVSGEEVYFSNFSDQRLYRQRLGSPPRELTAEAELRYADLVVDPNYPCLLCVREDHSEPGREPVNSLVSVSLIGEAGKNQLLVSGNDFYSSPRLSPDGNRLAWISWDHPLMPWDGTELWVGRYKRDGPITDKQLIAGGTAESILQPEWSPDGQLYFVSDRTGWWNLYRWRDGRSEPLCEMEAEFGAPHWLFRMSSYAFVRPDLLICAYSEKGSWRLGILDLTSRRLERIECPYTDIRYVQARGSQVAFCGGSPVEPLSVVKLDLSTRSFEVLRRSSNVEPDRGYLSPPTAIEFPTTGGQTAYGFFYPPRNRDYAGPSDQRPPLIVMSHGGPTSSAATAQNLGIQYWTSRGIAVLDVNYGGSTGFGRAYRERLNGNWGVVDVDDCVNGALYLAERGEVDANRLIIRGGSAGGYTTLCALTFRDVFKAGASYFGISDLEALETDTHKFESRYSHSLVGPYPGRRDLYRERSPIHFTERLSCAMILFQGLEDKVVPPNQAEMMYEAVRKKGLPVAYVPFPGEQHGFRRAENIKRALDAELYFYSKVFGFELAEPLEPVAIENLA